MTADLIRVTAVYGVRLMAYTHSATIGNASNELMASMQSK